MTRFLFALAFALGAVAVIWGGLTLPGGSAVALTATLMIGLVYAVGFVELWRFRAATAGLTMNLRSPPDGIEALEAWLNRLPLALRNPVRRRIEGEPAALPGPTLTPYLTGLLVMLGLLGTFIGMLVTLHGAVSALQGGSDLQAIRGSLIAPIAGMSLAFGTSIAGVAASAMLGLAAALSRRDRLVASRELDARVGSELRVFSFKQQRNQAYQALREQAGAFPAVVEQLQAHAGHLERMSEQLGETLTANQHRFQESMSAQYRELADTLASSLSQGLADSARLSAESARPVITAALEQLNRQTERTHRHLGDISERQLAAIAERFQATTEQAAESWRAGLTEHRQGAAQLAADIVVSLEQHDARFQQNSQALLEQAGSQQAAQRHNNAELVREIGATLSAHNEQFQTTAEALLAGQRDGLDTLVARIGEQLTALRDQEAQRAGAAGDRLAALEDTATRHLTSLGRALEEPMTRLIETASETPKAAAEVISQLRTEVAKNSERDNALLEERQRLISELDALLSGQREASGVQREAIEHLIRESGQVLADLGQAFASQVDRQAEKLDAVTAEITGSAHDVASLSDAFTTAVQLFGDANRQLVGNLERIETALAQSSARSDEQLAYYVEQARELIDLSMASQKDVLDALGALRGQGNI